MQFVEICLKPSHSLCLSLPGSKQLVLANIIYSIVVISIWKGPEPNWATPKGELEFGITDMPLLVTVNVIFNAVVEGVIV